MTHEPGNAGVDAIVQVAMLEEAQPFIDRADTVSAPTEIAGTRTHTLTYGELRISLVVSGIGLVNAAHAATAALLNHEPTTPIMSAGSAGGVGPTTSVGDVIVSTLLINLEADARAFGYALGQVPGMPPHYEADAALAEAAINSDHAQPVTRGGIGSGEKFVTAEHAHRIREDFPQVEAVDMESAAIAQVAHRIGHPFVSIRAVSDLCAPDGTEFLTHLDGAAERSTDVTLAALRHLRG